MLLKTPELKQVQYEEIKCKSALVKSKLPDADYVINPYVGCDFACSYCYAAFMGRFVNKSRADWGSYVYAKCNIGDVLAKELSSRKDKYRNSRVLLSSVTDPYQYAENKMKLTRKILSILSHEQTEAKICILTKSPLILRDIDLLKNIANVEIGFSITATSNKVAREMECNAPSITSRINALTHLNKLGFDCYAFIGPILPYLLHHPSELKTLFKKIQQTGTKEVYVEYLNPNKKTLNYIASQYGLPESRKEFIEQAKTVVQHEIMNLIDELGLKLRLNEVIQHGQ